MIITSVEDLIKEINWKPKSYVGKIGQEYIYYEKSWYCKENSVIHNNIKSVINCPYCCIYKDKERLKKILKEYDGY